jgi:Mpv17 / PMP22 family.
MKSHVLSKVFILFISIVLTCVQSFQLSFASGSNKIFSSRKISGREYDYYQPPSRLDNHNRHPVKTALSAEPLDVMVTMYKDSLMDNPVQTKMLTGGVLALLGDAIAQSREPRYDEKRAVAFVSFDVVYRAVQCSLFPIIVQTCDGHFLYPFFSTTTVDIRTLATMEQTFANQFLVIPFIYYPVFFTLTGYLQGLSMDATIERAQQTLFPLLKRNWLFWIPVQYFQFGYVEEPLQIPFLCVAGLAWTFILSALAGSVKSYDASNDKQGQEEEEQVMVGRPVSVTRKTMEEEMSPETLQV